MINIKKSFIFYCSIVLLLSLKCSNLIAQNTAQTPIHDWFDSKIGKENLDINNGKLLLNYDRVFNKVDRFFYSEYKSGSVIYDDQVYNNMILNYDVVNDDLILKPNGEFDKAPIIINKYKVKSFSINQKVYVNLNYDQPNLPEFINGFYEESYKGDNISFYVKHSKIKKDLINDINLYDDFIKKSSYFIAYKNTFYSISSKKSVIAIFPEYKKSINEYYSNNTIDKSDAIKFYQDFFKYLNNTIK